MRRSCSRTRASRQISCDETLPEFSDRIRVVPLCIDPDRVALWEQAESKGAPRREPAALIVGRMWSVERGKGHDELLAAWPDVRRKVPDAQLWIVGTGDDVPRLEEAARDLDLGDAVRFLGRVSDAELGALYRRASVFAMPSRQEGFGLVFAEAMWWGLPCIGTTADAAGQVIVAGETGELVPYGDVEALARTLVGLLSDPERASTHGRGGAASRPQRLRLRTLPQGTARRARAGMKGRRTRARRSRMRPLRRGPSGR